MGIARTIIICSGIAIVSVGCVVQPARPVYATNPTVEPAPTEGPVVQDPGVVLIDVEPAPVERVYVYEAGYPPGTYLWGGYYYYGRYRYPHDVFVNRVAPMYIQQNRYVNVEQNRRVGVGIENRHWDEYIHKNPTYINQHPEEVDRYIKQHPGVRDPRLPGPGTGGHHGVVNPPTPPNHPLTAKEQADKDAADKKAKEDAERNHS